MSKVVSEEFKNLSKKIKQQNFKLEIIKGETKEPVIAKELNYRFDGEIFKTIMQELDITVKKVDINKLNNQRLTFQYGIFVKNEFEYVDMGEYFIPQKDTEDDKKKEELTVTGYDKMINFMKPFKQSELQLKYPCKMQELASRMGEICGVELYSIDFFGADIIVTEDFFTVQELTYRDVLEKICQATLTTAFIKDNKLYFKHIDMEDVSQELDTSYLSNLIIEEKFGPVNALVLGRGDVEDNIESINQTSIEENGRCEVRFDENEFVDDKREELIDLMEKQIDGLEYFSVEANNLGLMWLEPCDVLICKDRENQEYKTIYLSANVKINTGISGSMSAGIPEFRTTEYKVTTKEMKKTLKVERLAKKNEGLIKDIIQETTENSEKISKHEQTIDSMKDTISSVETKVETVETKADNAQSTANSASSKADSAEATANSAKESAENAVGQVETTTEKMLEVEKSLDGVSSTLSETVKKVETVEGKADSAQQTADTANTNAKKAQTTADNANTNAQNAQKTADTVSKEIVTTNERVSKAEQTLDGFSQTVSSVEKEIEITNTKIDNLEIGGTQILRGTNNITSIGSSGQWTKGTWRKASGGAGTITVINVTDSPNANIKTGVKINITSTAKLDVCQDSVPVVEGEEYTMSCYARRTSGSSNLSFQFGVSDGYSGKVIQNITNKWVRYSRTFTIGAKNHIEGKTSIYFGATTAAGTLEICGMKLEKGNKDTDWSECPQDIENNIQTIKETVETTNERLATAEQTLDGFKQTVSSVETKVETVEKTANTAKNTADTAKSTADTANSTANTAKSTADKANTNANTALEQSKTTSQKVATMEETVEGFSQTVSSVQETLKTTNTKVENLENQEVGARNLLQYTAFENTKGVNVRGSYATISVDTANKYNGNNSLKIVTTASATSGTKDIWQKCWSNQVVGKKVKLSLWVKGSVTAKAWFRLAGSGSSKPTTTGTFNITTSWTKLEIDLGEVKTAGTAGSTELIYGFNVAGTFYVNSMKLEYGDKFTDWSPAPEDIEKTLETTYYTKEEANTQINQKITDSEASITASVNKSISTAKSEAINSANTNTANKLKEYSKTTEINTVITQKITDSEASITAEVNKKIDGLEFGGTQLLRGTGEKFTKIGTGKWADSSWRNASSGNGTKTFITVTNLPNGNIKKGVRITRVDANNTNANDLAQDGVPVANGQTYTMSCYAKKNSGDGVLKMQYGKSPYPSKTFNLTTAWAHYSFTFTIGEKSDGSTDGTTNIYFGATAKTGVVELCGFKLEKGNRESDWSPSPEDMEATFTELGSKIEQTEKDISAEVSGKIAESEKTLTAKIDLKLDTKNLISQINASADQINLKAGRLVITAGNFTLDANGKIKAVSGTVGGFTLSSSNFSSSINGVYNYDSYDIQKVVGCVLNGNANIATALKNILDANGDGSVSITDAGVISRIISGSTSNTKKWTGTFKINANDPKHCVSIMTGSTTCVSLGLGGVDAIAVTTQTLMCGTATNNSFTGTTISSAGVFANKIFTDQINASSHRNVFLSASSSGSWLGTDGNQSGKTTNLRGNTVRLYAHSGGAVYLGSSGSTAVTSDETQKDIFEIDDKYIDFFKNLKPITYIYKKGHRNHLGFGARQVENALLESGLTTEQFAGLIKQEKVTISADEMGTDEDVFFKELYSLRYEEFIALNTLLIQKQQSQIEELKEKLEILEKERAL